MVPENSVPLRVKVALVEAKLPAAVPKVEHEVAQEAHVGVLHVESGAEPHCVPCHVVRENDAAHRRLAGAGLTHQKHLLFAHSAAAATTTTLLRQGRTTLGTKNSPSPN